MLIGIVILNYKSWRLVVDCINSIKTKYSKDDYHIYIVDNGSCNESLKELSKLYGNDKDITIIDAAINGGFARGNNLGAKQAILDGCRYILFTNSDVLFKENSIENMKNTLSEMKNAIISYPVILNSDDTLQHNECMTGERNSFYDIVLCSNVLRKFVFKSVFYKYFTDIKKASKNLKYSDKHIDKKFNIIKTNMFFGCCFLVDAEKFEDVGMLDEETFLYYEEHILSTNALNKNYEMYISLDAKVYHLQGASSDISRSKWYEYVSKIYYYTKYKNYNRIFIKLDLLFNKLYSYIKCRSSDDFKKNHKNYKEAKFKLNKYLK